jgi:hypothetical protein
MINKIKGYYTSKEVCKLLKISRQRLHQIKSKLNTHRIDTTRYIYSKKSVQKLIKSKYRRENRDKSPKKEF